MVLTAENTLELPHYPTRSAPHTRHDQWFAEKSATSYADMVSEERHRARDFERDCEVALVVAGIGERDCPTPKEWAYYCIAGALTAALSGKYPVIPKPRMYGDTEEIVWEVLWKASEENKGKLDREFLAAILRILVPTLHHAPPDHPWLESKFCQWWGNIDFGYPDTPYRSISNVRLRRIRDGREALKRLPESAQASVRAVALHVPQMLDMAIEYIGRIYHW